MNKPICCKPDCENEVENIPEYLADLDIFQCGECTGEYMPKTLSAIFNKGITGEKNI